MQSATLYGERSLEFSSDLLEFGRERAAGWKV